MSSVAARFLAFIGSSGTGKTHALAYALSLSRRSLVVVLSPHGDGSFRPWLSSRSRYLVSDVTYGRRVNAEALARAHGAVVFSLHDLGRSDQEAFVESLAVAVVRRGNLALAFDDLRVLFPGASIPEAVVRLSRAARHYGVDLFTTSHRWRDMPVGMRVNVTHLGVFSARDEVDRTTLVREAGGGSAVLDQVASLRTYQYLWIDSLRDTAPIIAGPVPSRSLI